MHKFIANSLNKLKNLITEKSFKNVSSLHTKSNTKKPTVKDTAIAEASVIKNFNDIVTTRRAQAQRSILVQVNSEKSFTELQRYCSQYGTIIGAHHYTLTDDQFILVEYSNQIEANQAIENSSFQDTSGFCVPSPFLWFRAAVQNESVGKDFNKISGSLTVTDGCRPIDYDEINKILLSAESVSDQMTILYKSTTLNDLGIRLRFLAARQIETSISGIFPRAQSCIFGSSVNGYGKMGCDLDLILQLNPMDSVDETKRLVVHTKKVLNNARSQVQRNLENLSDMMQMFLPGVSHVRRILQARVPIVRYHHIYLDLEVDLSMNNMSGVYMSELLYMFTQIDDRVSPLVSTIRRWAQTNRVTNASPGVWISNFSLTCLVIFYLQQLREPVLPTINSLIQQARPQDKRTSNEAGELQGTFLRDLNQLKFTKVNTDSLDQLLIGFFEFYSAMSFSERAISLNDAKLHPKPDNSAVYIINPLEPSLNVTKNMSFEECQRFRTEVQQAGWMLESAEKRASKSDTWGLLNLFRAHAEPIIRPSSFIKSRMVEVDNLFDDTNVHVNGNGEMDKKVKFKNNSVKNEVANIQKKRRTDLNAMKSGGSKR